MTAPARIRQADLTRTLRAIKAADCGGARVRIDPDGTIDIMLGLADHESWGDSRPANPLDRVLDDAA